MLWELRCLFNEFMFTLASNSHLCQDFLKPPHPQVAVGDKTAGTGLDLSFLSRTRVEVRKPRGPRTSGNLSLLGALHSLPGDGAPQAQTEADHKPQPADSDNRLVFPISSWDEAGPPPHTLSTDNRGGVLSKTKLSFSAALCKVCRHQPPVNAPGSSKGRYAEHVTHWSLDLVQKKNVKYFIHYIN